MAVHPILLDAMVKHYAKKRASGWVPKKCVNKGIPGAIQKIVGKVHLPVMTQDTPCANLGIQYPAVQNCKCGTKTRKCEVHGLCTTQFQKPGVPCCRYCPDYVHHHDMRDEYKRHLLYFIYPNNTNDAWKINIDRIKQRMDLFNGKRIIAISTESKRHSLIPAEEVKAYMGKEVDYLTVPHYKKLGEVTAFERLWKSITHFKSSYDVTFYGHAKGVVSSERTPATLDWGDLMYKVNLDHWDRVREALQTHGTVGTFKIEGGPMCAWHYHGTFYWCRNADVFARWKAPPQRYGGTEMWPSSIFDTSEAKCLFQPPPGMLYDQGLVDIMKEQYVKWACLWDTPL